MIETIIVMSLVGLVASLIVTPYVGKFMRTRGKVGRDVHKIDRPEVPESGGIGYMIIYLILLIIGIFLAPNQGAENRFYLTLVVLSIVTIIGIIDDFQGLSAILKPGLLVIAAIPVFLFREIDGVEVAVPKPMLPFVGETNLTIVYWGLAIFVVAIPANASNMLDVMNGVMSFSGILIGLTAFIATYIIPLSEDSVFFARYAALSLVGVLLGFWWFNRYPASIFAGDTGSLGTGAAIGLIAIYGQLEFVLVVALLVHIMNSFSIISSVRGLRERKEMKHRPVTVEDGVIHASKDPRAPITMVRLIVARQAATEDQIVKQILLLVAYCCVLALISAFLIRLVVI
jgi:UDP-N-acetylglucosamine--dolichyl-phosphate N-acetylglucosaminephosphotransferase